MAPDREIDVLPDIVRYWAARTPDRRALVDERRESTYAQLDARSNAIARAPASSGVAPGDHVGFLGKKAVEFWETWFGSAKAGCGPAPFNRRCPAPELIELVDDAQVPVLVVGADFAATAVQVRDGAARAPQLVVFGDADHGLLGLEARLEGHDSIDPPSSRPRRPSSRS